jgi:hypothetical protein
VNGTCGLFLLVSLKLTVSEWLTLDSMINISSGSG